MCATPVGSYSAGATVTRRCCAMSHSAAPTTTAISGTAARLMTIHPAFACSTPESAAEVAVAV